MKVILIFSIFIIAAFTANFFKEDNFLGQWEKRWKSTTRDGMGKFEVKDGRLRTSQDAKFYAISSEMATTVDTKGKSLVVQLAVAHPQSIDCGGGYLKVVRDSLKQEDFKGDSEYGIMFGPDICGSTRKVHSIFNHNGKKFRL